MNLSGVDANRREIATAACTLVADGGLDNVSLRRIARHLGSTTGYISHYYVDKDDLLEAALLAALDELHRPPRRPETLDEWLEIAVETLPRDGEVLRFWRVLIAFQAASLHSPRLSAALSTYAPDSESALAELLTALVPRDTPSEEINGLARTILSQLSGFGITSAITPGNFTKAQQRAVVRSSVYGLIEEFIERAGASRQD